MNLRDINPLLLNKAGIRGEYFCRLNGGPWEHLANIVPEEGRTMLLDIAMGATPKPQFYIALFEGAAAPADNWTAASFAAAANENVSLTEGYTGATRPQWVPGTAAAGAIDNFATPALFTFASTGPVNINGVAMLTSNARGGTTGKLISAAKYPATRVFMQDDKFEVGYRLALTP